MDEIWSLWHSVRGPNPLEKKMHDQSERYELSFVSPRKGETGRPGFVFTIDKKHLPKVAWRLRNLYLRGQIYVEKYVGKEAVFTVPVHDPSGKLDHFGLERCGSVLIEDDQVHLKIELFDDHRLDFAAMTLSLLFTALGVEFPGKISNQIQQVDISSYCEKGRSGGYGHAVHGSLSDRVIPWLTAQSKKTSLDMHGSVELPKEIVLAMKAAWRASSSKGIKKYAEDCRGWVYSDGRFVLQCFGDACDLAIYPDCLGSDMVGSYVEFSCHNLDTAPQQVTLLAGLAKICELARRDET